MPTFSHLQKTIDYFSEQFRFGHFETEQKTLRTEICILTSEHDALINSKRYHPLGESRAFEQNLCPRLTRERHLT